MTIETSRFGNINTQNKEVINMVKGPYGFAKANKFVIIESEESKPFKWLQSVDHPDLAFVIVNPVNFLPNYEVSLLPEDKKDLKLKAMASKDTMIYVFVVIPSDPRQITANMLGPIVINSNNKLAKQVALLDERYSARYSLIQN